MTSASTTPPRRDDTRDDVPDPSPDSDRDAVLIVTRSDDNRSIDMVTEALRARGGVPIRLDTDRYPTDVRLSAALGLDDPRTAPDSQPSATRRVLRTPDGAFDLARVTSVWYRRFHAGARLPPTLGDMRPASVDESRRTLLGTIANLPCFHMDPLESVRRCDHKELQLQRALALGLDIPRTLFSNDPDEVRRFARQVDAPLVCKMQSSFAIYRGGQENVVFTNALGPADLDDLSGLRYCPMVFQERIDKRVELRATVVGHRVMTAAVDSQRRADTAIDWRRDGLGLIDSWQPYQLPAPVEAGLLALVSELGLNYAAADFAVTPDGRHVFFEVNAVGEFFWLQLSPGLPIVDAMADVLLGLAPRRPIALDAWRNAIDG